MSSPRGLRFEPSTTTTTIATTSASSNNHTNFPPVCNPSPVTAAAAIAAPPPPAPSQQQQYHNHYQELRPPTEESVRSLPPAKPIASISTRAAEDDGNASEAETVVLRGVYDARRNKESSLSPKNGGGKRDWKRGGENSGKERRRRGNIDNDNNNDDNSPRKRRRRSLSRSAARGRNANDERRSRGDVDDGDAEYSSDLSSARSSSPMRRMTRERDSLYVEQDGPRPERSRSYLHHASQHHNNSRKRKAPTDGTTTSDDEPPEPEPEPRPRRRRNSTLESSPQARKHSVRSSSPLPPNSRFSPTIVSKPRAQPGLKKQRKIPAPLNTSRDDPSDNDSSSSLSRQGSPTRHRRLHSAAARTPGSPISMSHKPKRDTAGRTHLHRACGRGAVQDVETILEQSVELINAEDNAGYMPIHEASLNGHLEVVKALVAHGALYDVQSRIDLESPLLDAVENGHVPVVQYLLELGADPRKRDRQGRSCLDANKEDDEPTEVREEIQSLLKAAIKQRPAQRTSDDETNRASVPVDRDSPSSRDASVASPAHQSPPAPQKGRRRNARAEQSRKDLLWLDSGKGSVIKLREKAREGDLQMVHALLETGLKPDTEALVGAIKGGHTELVSLLLAYAAEADPVPGQADREGSRRKREVSMPVGEETPMLAAIGRGNVEILRYLLENGVDPRRRDSRGRSYSEIAREREGEFWQEEVQLLKEAWQKAGSSNSPSETKSPSRHKSSPKSRSSAKQLRRNSSASSSSRTQSRPPTKRLTDDKATKRSVSVNPSHRLGDLPAVSDRESTTEPLGPPKARLGRPKRSDSDALTPGIAKKRRRLVSGKVRDEEEAARIGDPLMPLSERDSDSGSKPDRQSGKYTKSTGVKSDMEDTIRVESGITKPKIEPSEDIKMEDAPPLNRPKVKPTRERRPSTTRSDSTTRETKRHVSRTRSPPKAPRSDIERRQAEEKLRRRKREDYPDDRDRYPRRRDSLVEEPRRLREGRHSEQHPRPTSVSSEPSRRRDDSRRPNRDEPEKPRQTEEERRRRIREKDKEEDRDRRERKSKDERPNTEKRIKETERMEGITQEQLDQEAREILRMKYLTKELALIQKKAAKDSKDRKADEVITRELELRRVREKEEQRQRAIREQEEREQEEREAREKAEREEREREAKEKEEFERAAKAREEQERLEREAREREAREAREREERERIAMEKAEQKRKEREARELEEREAKEREIRLEEERQREVERQLEEERRRKEQERLAAEAEERRRKEEAEKQRLEQERLEENRRIEEAERKRKAAEEEAKRQREKAEKEARDRKIAEELQQQLAQEQEARRIEEEAREAARIQSLPYTLRNAAENEARGRTPEDYRHFIPLFAATFPAASHPTLGNLTPNGITHTWEKWVLNIQVALALGTNDLTFNGYQLTERRPATEHERLRMWSVLSPILCEDLNVDSDRSTKSMEERAASRMVEKEKYLNIQHVFWIKFDDILSIISSDPRHQRLLNHPISTVDVTMDLPTPGKGSPGGVLNLSKEEMATRIKRRFSTQSLKSPPRLKGPDNVSSNSHSSKSMPPPTFGINSSSGSSAFSA
ncbi:hypothetical protein K440DRAFT_637146 [Wilcoxina mikolae CBS 423.85]|nr:hypothetical protein K440DRAFT_637146 [Wilcoxina mikolae CBS 423.85]